MKRMASYLSAVFFLLSPCHAAFLSGTGSIYVLQVLDDRVYGQDKDWFSLVGVTSLGACRTIPSSGYVALRIRDDAKGQRMFANLLAAKTSGTPLTVWVDDTITDSDGYCFVLNMQ
jgi:hypothetical protein